MSGKKFELTNLATGHKSELDVLSGTMGPDVLNVATLARDHLYSELPQICTELALDRGGDDNITVVVVLACNDHDERQAVRQLSKTAADTLPSLP